MANVNITFNDPGGLLSSVPLLAPTIRAAVSYLDQFVVFRGILDVNVNVETTSTGRFAGSGDLALTAPRDGLETWESAMAAESRTGTDPHPGTPDLSIFIDPRSSYLAGLWWDPNIGSSLAGRVPTDKTDAFSVVLHELLHGMGAIGWRNIDSGSLPSNYQSVWDSYVVVNGNRATFNGPATVALLGQGAEVRLGGSQGAYHLGNGPDLNASQMPWIEASNLNGYYFFLGERYLLGHLELALLQDLGWTLEPTTLTDVVNRYDGRVTARYMIGWDGGDQITGDVLGDRLEGRAGADLLVGLDGDDTLDGGTGDDTLLAGIGNDTVVGGSDNDRLDGGGGNDQIDGGGGLDKAVYSLARASYSLTLAAGTTRVQANSGSEGVDTLVGIERLLFADRSLALDLNGSAGLTARLIGAVFGPGQVSNRDYVGIGLSLFDAGKTPLEVAQLAIDARLGVGAKPADIVNTLYGNVVGVLPGAADLAYFTGLLDSRASTPASLTLMAAETSLTADRIDLIGLQLSGLEYVGG